MTAVNNKPKAGETWNVNYRGGCKVKIVSAFKTSGYLCRLVNGGAEIALGDGRFVSNAW